MIKIEQKPFQEIVDCIQLYDHILNVGCGGCASVCMGGGQKEVNILNAELEMYFDEKNQNKEIGSYTVERACNMTFLEELDEVLKDYDCILSMACSAGVQFIAERFPNKPVFPAINTVAIGVDRDIGLYEEKCRACGDCVIGYTGGICPVTRCAKGLFNGPCGGTNGQMCEVHKDIPCAWYEIYERLSAQNRLEDIYKIREPMEWQNQVQRAVVHPDYAHRYMEEE